MLWSPAVRIPRDYRDGTCSKVASQTKVVGQSSCGDSGSFHSSMVEVICQAAPRPWWRVNHPPWAAPCECGYTHTHTPRVRRCVCASFDDYETCTHAEARATQPAQSEAQRPTLLAPPASLSGVGICLRHCYPPPEYWFPETNIQDLSHVASSDLDHLLKLLAVKPSKLVCKREFKGTSK